MDQLRRVFECEVKAESAEGAATRFEAIASTSDTDRHGEILHASGCKLIKGAPLLYGHDYWNLRHNIGGVDSAKAGAGATQVICGGTFDDDIAEHTDAIIAARKAKKKRLNHLSVGFNPLVIKMRDGEIRVLRDGDWFWGEPGTEYIEWELMELSFVPVPANPNAELISARGLEGPGGREMRLVLAKALEEILGNDEFLARLNAARAAKKSGDPDVPATPPAAPAAVLDEIDALLSGSEPAAVANASPDPDALTDTLAEALDATDELDSLFTDAGPSGAGEGAVAEAA